MSRRTSSSCPPRRVIQMLRTRPERWKKIWSLEKIQKILDMLDPDPYKLVGSRATAAGAVGKSTRSKSEPASAPPRTSESTARRIEIPPW